MGYFHCSRGDAPCLDKLLDHLGGADCCGAVIYTSYDPFTRKAAVDSLHFGKPTDKLVPWSSIPLDIASSCEEIIVEATEMKFEELWANPSNAKIFKQLMDADGCREGEAYW